MPIYEYLCDDCQTRYERLVMSSNGGEAFPCPKCGSRRHTLQLSVFRAGKSGRAGESVPDSSGGASSSGGGCCSPGSCGCH